LGGWLVLSEIVYLPADATSILKAPGL